MNSPPRPAAGQMALEALRGLQTGLVVCNAAGAVLLANPAAAALLGGPLEPGARIDDVLGPLAELERASKVVVRERPGGPIEVSYQVLATGPDRRVVVLEDVTDLARARERRDSVRRLVAAGHALPQLLRALQAARRPPLGIVCDRQLPEA